MLRQSLKRLLPTAVTAPPDEWLRLRPEQLEPLQFARPRGGNMRASRGLYFWDARRPMALMPPSQRRVAMHAGSRPLPRTPM